MLEIYYILQEVIVDYLIARVIFIFKLWLFGFVYILFFSFVSRPIWGWSTYNVLFEKCVKGLGLIVKASLHPVC